INLAVTLTSGASANILPNLEVGVFSSGGGVKGRLRVATGGTISDSKLPINEISAGTVNVQATDVLIVRAELRIRNKLVAANATFDVDSRITMTTENDAPPPVVNSGGIWVGWTDPGETYATVPFQGSTSYALDPDTTSPL